jgi:hypothetical protein
MNINFILLFGCLLMERNKITTPAFRSEHDRINYNISIPNLPLFKNMVVEEIIKCNKKKMQNSNYLMYRFHSIVYLLNWIK